MSDFDPIIHAGRDLALALKAAHDELAALHGCDGGCVYLFALRQWNATVAAS